MGITMTMDEIRNLTEHVFVLYRCTETYNPTFENVEEDKKFYIIHETKKATWREWYEIRGKDYSKDIYSTPILDDNTERFYKIKLTNKTLRFGIKDKDNFDGMWDKFIKEGIIPELEQQGVTVVKKD